MGITFIQALPEHLPTFQSLILEDGANVWNWLPADGIAAHIHDIGCGAASAVLAMEGEQLVGAVSFCSTQDFARYQAAQRKDALHGYICEAVVRRDQVGRGIGAQLLELAVQTLKAQGLQEIYIDRHEENAASAGMMRKAGFLELETFAEPERRPHGSGRTTVCRRLV
jgi:ribosomal protein S18 acetylase RimI-like enzyme